MSEVNNQFDFFKQVNVDTNGNLGVVVTGGGGPGGNTIYTADDSLTGNRIVDLNSNSLTFTGGDINITDSNKLSFGNSDDLLIYHDATLGSSFIEDAGQGNLILLSDGPDGIVLGKGSIPVYERMIKAIPDAGVELYHDNNLRLLTRNAGVDITGNLEVTGLIDSRDVALDGTKLDTISTNADVTLDSISAGANITISPAGVIASTGGGGGSGIGTKVIVLGKMNSTQSFVGGVDERIDYETVGGFDINGEWSNTNYKFTVGSSGAGVYQFMNALFIPNNAGWSKIYLKKNGVAIDFNYGSDWENQGTSWDTPNGFFNIELAVGDEIEYWLRSTTNFTFNATYHNQNIFQITKIGDSSVVNNIVAQTLNKGLTLEEPAVNDDITILRTDVDIVIQEVIAVSTGTSPDTTYDIKYSTDRDAAGTSLVSSEQTTSTTTGDIATISNTNIPANSYVWLEVSAASGTDVYLNLDIRYTEA